MECLNCKQPVNNIKDVAKCGECDGFFHPQCFLIKTAEALRKLGAKSETWRCDSCRSEAASTKSDADQSEILEILKSIKKEMAEGRKESNMRFDNLETSLKELDKSFEEQRQIIKCLEEQNVKLQEDLQLVKEDNRMFAEDLCNLRLETLELQRRMRRNNLEIKGVPWSQRENTFTVVETIAGAIGVQYSKGEISAAHRLPSRGDGHPTIIIAFVSRQTKDMWLEAGKRRRLNTTDLSQRLEPGPVYINSHMIVHDKRLLGRAKAMVREGKLAAAWTTGDKVLVKKTDGARAVRVVFLEDLDKL